MNSFSVESLYSKYASLYGFRSMGYWLVAASSLARELLHTHGKDNRSAIYTRKLSLCSTWEINWYNGQNVGSRERSSHSSSIPCHGVGKSTPFWICSLICKGGEMVSVTKKVSSTLNKYLTSFGIVKTVRMVRGGWLYFTLRFFP